MDPAMIGAVLAAVAGGVGGALGSQLWDGVSALVRRPFHSTRAAGASMGAVPSGEAELVALAQAPYDERRAMALAAVLVARAEADSRFAEALQSWWEQARQVEITGNATNTISGGTQYGPVLQGRDFTGLTFGVPAPPAAPGPPADSAREQGRQ